jgi:ferredoxin-fold anticodon binding domain-containing protein
LSAQRVSGKPRLYDGLNVAPKAHAFARECRQNVNRAMIGLLRNDGCRHLDKGLADINRRALQRDNLFS